MPANPERELARLRARFQQRAEELSQIGFMIRGSIIERLSRCGSTGCGCHDEPPRLHGPYWQWTSKVKGKTVTRNLSDDEVSRYREWMENAKRFDQIVQDLHHLSAEADQVLRTTQRESASRKVSAPGPPARS
jgi:hypothetical protein